MGGAARPLLRKIVFDASRQNPIFLRNGAAGEGETLQSPPPPPPPPPLRRGLGGSALRRSGSSLPLLAFAAPNPLVRQVRSPARAGADSLVASAEAPRCAGPRASLWRLRCASPTLRSLRTRYHSPSARIDDEKTMTAFADYGLGRRPPPPRAAAAALVGHGRAPPSRL